jgi:hypothetical protein
VTVVTHLFDDNPEERMTEMLKERRHKIADCHALMDLDQPEFKQRMIQIH